MIFKKVIIYDNLQPQVWDKGLIIAITIYTFNTEKRCVVKIHAIFTALCYRFCIFEKKNISSMIASVIRE